MIGSETKQLNFFFVENFKHKRSETPFISKYKMRCEQHHIALLIIINWRLRVIVSELNKKILIKLSKIGQKY